MMQFTQGQFAGTSKDTDHSRLKALDVATNAPPAVLAQTVVAVALLSAGLLLVVYGLTIAPDLTWANYSQDGGELITAAVTLGVPHPPGYPSYVLIGKLFSLLPVGTVAFRLNLFSAVATVLAGGLLAALLQIRSKPTKMAVAISAAAGVTFGLLPIVWSQATIAEVYALNLAFIAACFFCLLGLRKAGPAGLFLGLAITGHLSSLLLLPLAFYLTASKNYRRLAVGIALGLIPILLIVPFSLSGSPVIWGAPHTLEGWMWLVSGQLYGANLQLPSSASDLWSLLSRPHIWLSPLVILAGILIPCLNWSRIPESGRREGMAMGLTAAAFALFALVYQTNDAFVLLIPGLFILTTLAFTRLRPPLLIALLIPAVLLATGFGDQNLQNERTVRPIAEAVLTAAPQDAIVVTPGDRSIFTLWYFQHVEERRVDLILVDANLFAFDWYREQLQAANPHLVGLMTDDLPGFLEQNNYRSQCFTGLVDPSSDTNRDDHTYLLGATDQAPYLNCRIANP